jgi:hypothetical protein
LSLIGQFIIALSLLLQVSTSIMTRLSCLEQCHLLIFEAKQKPACSCFFFRPAAHRPACRYTWCGPTAPSGVHSVSRAAGPVLTVERTTARSPIWTTSPPWSSVPNLARRTGAAPTAV